MPGSRQDHHEPPSAVGGQKRGNAWHWGPTARRAFADRLATWWATNIPDELPVAAGRHGRLLLDGAADLPQVPPEGVGRFGCPPRQVFAEGCLLAQGLTGLDLTGLIPLDVADLPGCDQDLASLAGRDEHHAVVITEYDVADARLIFPPAVVDDQHVTMRGAA